MQTIQTKFRQNKVTVHYRIVNKFRKFIEIESITLDEGSFFRNMELLWVASVVEVEAIRKEIRKQI